MLDWIPHATDALQACQGSVAEVGKQHEQIRNVDVAVAVQVALDSARRDLAGAVVEGRLCVIVACEVVGATSDLNDDLHFCLLYTSPSPRDS